MGLKAGKGDAIANSTADTLTTRVSDVMRTCVDFIQRDMIKGLITWAGLARLAGLVCVCRDLSMFVKRNKNQLRDYMTTGPAHTEAAWLTGQPGSCNQALRLANLWPTDREEFWNTWAVLWRVSAQSHASFARSWHYNKLERVSRCLPRQTRRAGTFWLHKPK